MGENKNKQIQFYASLFVLIVGVALVFISLFLQPVGIIHYTVLSAFGMFLTFVGAVWQLDVKYTFKTEELRIGQRVMTVFHNIGQFKTLPNNAVISLPTY